MAQITVTYRLSSAGQRANLLDGAPANREQTTFLPASEALLAKASISDEGRAWVRLVGRTHSAIVCKTVRLPVGVGADGTVKVIDAGVALATGSYTVVTLQRDGPSIAYGGLQPLEFDRDPTEEEILKYFRDEADLTASYEAQKAEADAANKAEETRLFAIVEAAITTAAKDRADLERESQGALAKVTAIRAAIEGKSRVRAATLRRILDQ